MEISPGIPSPVDLFLTDEASPAIQQRHLRDKRNALESKVEEVEEQV